MKRFLCLTALSVGLVLPSQAASVIENYSYAPAAGIPDGNPSGWVDAQVVVGSSITTIEDITISLDIAGTYNGDLFVTLQHSSGFAVLLNRVGRDGGTTFGYDNDGFDVTLNDLGGFGNIHTQDSGGGLLSGMFGSDGRTTDPSLVVTGDAPTALLSSFVGLDANGSWVLFAADLSGGDVATVNGWSMEITGVPEPGTTSMLLLSALALAARRKR